MRFRMKNEYELFCDEIINSIKFLRKQGFYARFMYLEYDNKIIKLNGQEKKIFDENIEVGFNVIISQDMLYPVFESSSINNYMNYFYVMKNAISDKDILIKFDLLSYEEKHNVENIIDKYKGFLEDDSL
jgi:hypothetical protein